MFSVGIRAFTVGERPIRSLSEELKKNQVAASADSEGGSTAPLLMLVAGLDVPGLDETVSSQSSRRLVLIVALEKSLDPERIWALVDAGASEVIAVGDDLASAAAPIVRRLRRIEHVASLLRSPEVTRHVIGQSPRWRAALRQLVEVAHFSNSGVLITGETGTGKEVAARLVHALDARQKKGPFVVLDCSTVSPELAGSEMFGHVRGAYTGAISERPGALSLADGGTLFLDELGELPSSVQAQLLRATEDGMFKPVGAIQWRRSRFRLVCATNRDLSAEVQAGRFRLDLFHRVLAWHVHLPPLRDRKEDILQLARHFIAELIGPSPPPGLDRSVERYLLERDYPGNIRDLRSLIVRMLTCHVGDGPITAGDVPPADRPFPRSEPWPDGAFQRAVRRGLRRGRGLKGIRRDAEAIALEFALSESGGSTKLAAEILGVTERAVQLRRAGGDNGR